MNKLAKYFSCLALIFTLNTSAYSQSQCENLFIDADIEAKGNYSQALITCSDEAAQGDPNAQFFLGQMYYSGAGVSQDYAKAEQWTEKAANQGHTDAQYFLGMLHIITSQGQNSEKAIFWFEKAAAQEHASAQNMLGNLYSRGIGIQQNTEIAKEWFQKACRNGNQESCNASKKL